MCRIRRLDKSIENVRTNHLNTSMFAVRRTQKTQLCVNLIVYISLSKHKVLHCQCFEKKQRRNVFAALLMPLNKNTIAAAAAAAAYNQKERNEFRDCVRREMRVHSERSELI